MCTVDVFNVYRNSESQKGNEGHHILVGSAVELGDVFFYEL